MNSKLFVSSVLATSLLSPVYAKYPEQSDPKEGARLMKELREQLNIKYDGKNGVFPQNKVAVCRADEERFFGVQKEILNPLMETIQRGDHRQMEKFFSTSAVVDHLSPQVRPKYSHDGVTVYQWERSQTELSPVTKNKLSELTRYLKEYKQILNAEVDTFDFQVDHDWRNPDHSYRRLNAMMEMRINGLNAKGHRQSDRMNVVADLRQDKKGWSIAGIKFLNGERVVANRAPAFKEITQDTGLKDVPIHLRREAIRRGGYSVAVTDFDNNSVPDLFFGTGGEAESLIGKKDKSGNITFSRSQKDLPQGTFVKSSVFADFDNDGDQDAVLVRFVQDFVEDDELVFFRNDGKGKYTYEPLLKKASINKRWAMPAAVGDFNVDGFLDLYVGYPGKKDFTTYVNPLVENNKDVLPHGMFFNTQGKSFSNVTKSVIPDLDGVEGSGYLFPHSALAFDYDHNRTTDLIVIDDRDNLSPMYRNNGRTFDQVAQKIGLGNSGYGMSVATGDFNNDGLIDIAMTNVNLVGEERFRAACDRNWNVKPDPIAKGLRLFQNQGKGKFVEVTDNANLGWPGAATGGVLFTDYNNDGYEDLYVVNGLWSGTNKGNELDSFWATANIKNNVLKNSLKYHDNKTQSLVMNLLIHYQDKGQHPSLGGFQRNMLYKNNGDGTFTNVAFLEGVDAIADGYAVVSMDLNRDGKSELLLRNADPGTAANKFPSVQLFRNELVNENRSISITLKGTDSSRDAIGTEIEANVAGQKMVRQLLANNGPQQSERVVHFGLGKAEKADLTIRWPNGKVESFKGVSPGFHEYIEPSTKQRISQSH